MDETLKAARDRLLELDQYQDQLQKVVLCDDVDDAYERLLSTRSRFIHWYKRLQRDRQEPQLSFILSILRHVARSDDGLTRRQLVSRLVKLESDPHKRNEVLTNCLAYLEENGYLSEDPKIKFLSFLLRDYWKNNYAD